MVREPRNIPPDVRALLKNAIFKVCAARLCPNCVKNSSTDYTIRQADLINSNLFGLTVLLCVSAHVKAIL
jgi:hypothetical protein